MFFMITDKSPKRLREHFDKVRDFHKLYDGRMEYVKVRGVDTNIAKYDESFMKEFNYNFSSIEPLMLGQYMTKAQIIEKVAVVLQFFTFCYNTPLTIYIGKEKELEKMVGDMNHIAIYSSHKRFDDMQMEVDGGNWSKRLPNEDCYFNCDVEYISREIRKMIKGINTRQGDLWKIRMTKDNIEFIN